MDEWKWGGYFLSGPKWLNFKFESSSGQNVLSVAESPFGQS
jgi:hypothetical protein